MKARASLEQSGTGPRDVLVAFVGASKRSAFVRRQTRYTLMDLSASQSGLPAHRTSVCLWRCSVPAAHGQASVHFRTGDYQSEYREEIKRILEMFPYSKWDITGQHPCGFGQFELHPSKPIPEVMLG